MTSREADFLAFLQGSLCIFRGLVLEAQVPGTAVIDARGASAGPGGRRAIFIDFGRTNTLGRSPYTSSTRDTVELIGLKITGGKTDSVQPACFLNLPKPSSNAPLECSLSALG